VLRLLDVWCDKRLLVNPEEGSSSSVAGSKRLTFTQYGTTEFGSAVLRGHRTSSFADSVGERESHSKRVQEPRGENCQSI
jgi:hypothetical protein